MNIKQKTKKNGQTVYQASLYLGVDSITGKKVRTTITARTKKEVQLKARQKQNEFDQKGGTVYQEVKITYFHELLDLWFDTYRLGKKENTIRVFNNIKKNYILPTFGHLRIDKITTLMLQTTVNQWAIKSHRKQFSNSRQNGVYQNYARIFLYVKKILKYAVKLNLIQENPASAVEVPPIPKLDSNKKFYFTDDELKKILSYIEEHNSNYSEKFINTLIKLLLATGLRIGEACALEWTDIDFKAQTISVTKTLNSKGEVNSPKTKSSIRTIDVDHSTVAMLAKFKKEQQKEAMKFGRREKTVFSTISKLYPSVGVLRLRLYHILKEINVERAGYHAFRHTHASLLLNAGVPYKQLQLRLGHASLQMTMDIYAHLSKESLKETASIFERKMTLLKLG
ncbi:TPA: site-specific integrase [Streptococcus suis]|nr:site-specific integrase [Streptococcus suis]HEM4975115.1 site-specific integrase [Streptococcus suis]HEM5288959.1 site-specific integrase [Streptococcus suis]HEM5299150.1 site-specific integrase [Streptococcus suis]HEM5302671.1 site-specific integrase [Streptococcus suis]